MWGTNYHRDVGQVKVGVAGWAYKDWEGIVYPKRQKAAPHPLEILAQFVDVVEINTSFYGHVAPSQAKLWCEKAAGANRDFVFTAKLNRCFTHAPMAAVQPTSAETLQPNPEDEKLAKAGLDALAQENRLGALLAQFPISFKNTDANREYLHKLTERFGHLLYWLFEGMAADWRRRGLRHVHSGEITLRIGGLWRRFRSVVARWEAGKK